jgi:periplasmic protein TonB
VFVADRDSLWDNRSRRRWTSLASFAVEMGIAAGLLSMPLLEPQGRPLVRSIESLPLLAAPAGRASSAREHRRGALTRKPIGQLLLTPTYVPREIPNLAADVPPPPDFLGGNGTAGDAGSNNLGNSLLEGLGAGPGPSFAPSNPPPPNHPPRISHSMEGSLTHRVQPEYPPLARQARIQGTVLLRAIIDREGKIENLQVLGGHPLLVEAAFKAVQQWRYRPYYLNGQPVEVETQITVHFALSGG